MKQDDTYSGAERREFVRFDFNTALGFKVCKNETISRLLEGYTSNISEVGLLCSIKEKVSKDDILWLSFDRATLSLCEALEKKVLIYQNGIIGKVVRIEPTEPGAYDVGMKFLTREERNSSHIYPKVHFLEESFRK